MKRFASTRSDVLASQPGAGRAQCSVGSIDEDGILYGFTTQALIARTIATAPAIVTTQSIATRHPCGRFGKRRSIGLRGFFWGTLGVVAGALFRIAEHLVGVPELAPRAVLVAPLECDAPIRSLDRLRRRVGAHAEDRVVVAHRTVRRRLCSRRHSSIFPWSPESRTSGTRQPRNSGGRV